VKQVPTLVDHEGYLWNNVADVAQHAAVEEVRAELQAQLDLARRLGLEATHIDTHMGAVFARPDLAQAYLDLARDNQILPFLLELTPWMLERIRERGTEVSDELFAVVQDHGFPKIDYYTSLGPAGSFAKARDAFVSKVCDLPRGISLILFHPALESEELRLIVPRWRQRVFEAELFQDPRVQEVLSEEDLILTTWREVGERFAAQAWSTTENRSTSVVVPTFGPLESTTRPCLRSLLSCTAGRHRLVLVDNARPDGTAGYLASMAERFPQMEFVSLRENLGWAGGCLRGLQLLQSEDDCFCLLNTDTQVTPGWLERLQQHLERHPQTAMVIPTAYGEGEAPPRVADLQRADRQVQQSHAGESESCPPSGFCALVRVRHRKVVEEYLRHFDDFWSGRRDWQKFYEENGLTCRRALDTLVYHARAGSGGYPKPSRSS
jgi:predicted glycoside hydrolase/deacetylase ChbG (UPF0249 family)